MTMNRKLGGHWLIPASLALTLAAFGCTSNQYAGNGQPTIVTPTYNHATTPGSSSGTEGVPPMASSFTYLTPRVDVDGLANLAAMQGYRGRVLGPSGAQGYLPGVTATGGILVSPALTTNPQATVNTSISSQPVPVITGGEVGAGINIVSIGTTGITGASTAGTPAAATTIATTGTTAATAALTASGSGTTVAGSAAFAPAMMNSTPAPQATGSTGPTLATVVATGKSPSGSSSSTMMARNTAAVTAPIRIETGTSGNITVTNISSNSSAAHH